MCSTVCCTSCTRCGSTAGHVHVHVREPSALSAVASGQRHRDHRSRPRTAQRLVHVRRGPARRERQRDITGRAPAPRSAARRPPRNRSRSTRPQTIAGSDTSAITGHAGRATLVPEAPHQFGGEVLRVGRAASIAEHQHFPASQQGRPHRVGPPLRSRPAARPRRDDATPPPSRRRARQGRSHSRARPVSPDCRVGLLALRAHVLGELLDRQLHRRPRRAVLRICTG